jgi:hypothetical protein
MGQVPSSLLLSHVSADRQAYLENRQVNAMTRGQSQQGSGPPSAPTLSQSQQSPFRLIEAFMPKVSRCFWKSPLAYWLARSEIKIRPIVGRLRNQGMCNAWSCARLSRNRPPDGSETLQSRSSTISLRGRFSGARSTSIGRAARFWHGASPIRWTHRSASLRSRTPWRGSANRRYSTPIKAVNSATHYHSYGRAEAESW